MPGYYSTGPQSDASRTCKECRDGTWQTFTISATNSCPAGPKTTKSVLLSSGQFVWSLPLLSIPALGAGGWGFQLNYLPRNDIDGIIGRNFNFTQNLQLIDLGGGDVQLSTGENTRETFVSAGGGAYTSTGNNTAAVLRRTGAGTSADEFTLTASFGSVTTFFGFHASIAAPGRIKSTADRYGNGQTYTWANTAGMAQLLSVTDAYARTVTYRYYGSEAGNRLREIEDFLGRNLNFQYDTAGRLVAVVTPSLLKAAPGNTFPGGTAYVFQYDAANPRTERRDDLVKIWYPNQATPFIDVDTRTVDVARVYADATPRYVVEYGQDPTDVDHYGKVVRETVGDPAAGVGGTSTFLYVTTGLPTNDIDPSDPIVGRTVVTDRNGNQVVYDFTAAAMLARKEVLANRTKNSLQASSFVTWTSYNAHNQPLVIVMPEGNSVEYEYEDGTVSGITGTYSPRDGLLLRETALPGNSIGVPSRAGSNGQTELTRRWFYDPVYNQPCATIERRGNPIAAPSTYFTPQNLGATPTDADRRRPQPVRDGHVLRLPEER